MYTFIGIFGGMIIGTIIASICGMQSSRGYAPSSGDFIVMASLFVGGGVGLGIDFMTLMNGTHFLYRISKH